MSTAETPSVFTQIINREIPATIIYEDEAVIAFFTIEPHSVGHTLVVPKIPFVNIFDGNQTQFGEMMAVAKKIATGLVNAKLADGVNITMNNGTAAAQEVFHAHIHVIPRKMNDGLFVPLTHKKLDVETLELAAEKLKASLA